MKYGHKFYDFMHWNYAAFTLSSVLIIASIATIIECGFNLGIDFTGGIAIELSSEHAVNLEQIKDILKHANFMDPIVQNFGNSHDVIIRISPGKEILSQEISNKVLKTINHVIGQNVIAKQIEFIGPNISKDLTQESIIALLISLICVLIYTSFRFEWRLATGAVLALIHDITITLGVLSIFHIEIDMKVVASLMFVIGYSLNDSIVISDRIRENFRKIQYYKNSSQHIFNISLTQTFSRTIITSVTTLIMVLILLIFGGTPLRGFSITLFVGIFIGTLSSIYVASALALKLGMKREHLLQ